MTETKTAIAVYQDGYAIFGVGKTIRSAKMDARKWVDNRDLSGLDVVSCTIAVFNGIKDGSIDSQGRGYAVVRDTRGNTLIVSKDEAEKFERFQNFGTSVVME
ncbi:MAG: hypothetical protein WC295_01515 [Methanoregula sp.]|jgi:hypothetical protein